MTPINQSIVDKGDGDCFRAAVASVLDLSLEQVPHFIRYGEDWFKMYWHFIKYFGWDYAGNCSPGAKRGIKPEDSLNGYFLATVPSATFEGVTHSVIMDIHGIIVHDPNPNKYYQGKSKEEANVILWHMFERLETRDD